MPTLDLSSCENKESDFEILNKYLNLEGIITDEVLNISKPGEGNMNVVLRVGTNSKSFIFKQAYNYVAKYPQIAAPANRIDVEHQFYKMLEKQAILTQYMPHVLHFDPSNNLMILEDLGKNSDFLALYKNTDLLNESTFAQLIDYLSILHNLPLSQTEKDDFPTNIALRKLNHEHLFVYPYLIENGLNLDSITVGLNEVALAFKTDQKLKESLNKIGEIYLGKGNVLIHGDFYPGSWLNTEKGVQIIDPEFSFIGHAEYDLGVLIAHLKMAKIKEELIEILKEKYKTPENFDWWLAQQFVGMEILRRIIGLAQLPLELNLDQKIELMIEAKALILGDY